jgi:hypothetical protein
MVAECPDPAAPPRGPAKTVRHWRAFDPVRRMAERQNASGAVTAEHVAACDVLRQLWDAARFGFSGGRMPWMYHEPGTTPTTPTPAAVLQARVHVRVQRCLKRFSPLQQDLIHHVILLCAPWCHERGHCSAQAATKRLLVVLDMLRDYFKSEITRLGLPA